MLSVTQYLILTTVDDAIGFTYTFEGQNFYTLTFPSRQTKPLLVSEATRCKTDGLNYLAALKMVGGKAQAL